MGFTTWLLLDRGGNHDLGGFKRTPNVDPRRGPCITPLLNAAIGAHGHDPGAKAAVRKEVWMRCKFEASPFGSISSDFPLGGVMITEETL